MHGSLALYKFSDVFLIIFSSLLAVDMLWETIIELRDLDHPESCSFQLFLVILDNHYI